MTEKRIINGAKELLSLTGHTLGTSSWLTVDQTMIDSFGRTTGDEQWIHMDPERASSGPYGGTIAHGFLALSLLPVLANQVFEVTGFAARVNYGLDKVRFPSPLRVNSQVRNHLSIKQVEETASGLKVTFADQLESSTGDRPVCVAERIVLFSS